MLYFCAAPCGAVCVVCVCDWIARAFKIRAAIVTSGTVLQYSRHSTSNIEDLICVYITVPCDTDGEGDSESGLTENQSPCSQTGPVRTLVPSEKCAVKVGCEAAETARGPSRRIGFRARPNLVQHCASRA